MRRLVLGWFAVQLVGTVLLWTVWLAPPRLEVPPAGVVLERVRIVEPGEAVREAQRVVVEGDSIAAIEPDPGTQPSEFAGMYVSPGLVDMHVHAPPDTPLGDVALFGLLYLRHGVTAVRDTGNFDGAILETRRRIRDGDLPGPRTFACGPILDGDPPVWPASEVVRTADEARAAVARLAGRRVDCIKGYSNLSAEAGLALAEAAREHGLPYVGHVPNALGLATSGLDDVQHLTGLSDDDTLSDADVRAYLTHSVVRGIAHTPTLVVLDRLSRLADGVVPQRRGALRFLPHYYPERIWNPRLDRRFATIEARQWDEMRGAIREGKRVVAALVEAGVRVHVGTDTMNPFVLPGEALQEEMRELLDAGMPWETVWRAGTVWAGEGLGVPGLGRVRAGAPADLLIFARNPLEDPDALESLQAVVAQGRLYRVRELDRALEAWRRHVEDSVYRAVTTAVARVLF